MKILSTVALEQQARCGQQEHIHGKDCYLGEVLICGQKAHTHGDTCYLLLLSDNDINRLLSDVDQTEEKSLETVIDTVMMQALKLDSKEPDQDSEPIRMAAENISWLNRVIESQLSGIVIVLNEDLKDSTLVYDPPVKEIVTTPEVDAVPTEASRPVVSRPAVRPVTPTQPTPPVETTAPEVTTEPTETSATEPPVTEPPATQPPVTEPPATQPPVTEPPATQPPVTEPPAIQPPVTEPPATQPPATEPPATQPPVTEPPASQPPVTEPPVTEPPEDGEVPPITEPPEGMETPPVTEPPEGDVPQGTEPPATTQPTEPPATTEPPPVTEPPEGEIPPVTEPPEGTEVPPVTEAPPATEAPEGSGSAEKPPVTQPTVPQAPETTPPAENLWMPMEPRFEWNADGNINMLAGNVQEKGHVGLYIYLDGVWTYIRELDMNIQNWNWGTNHSITAERVRDSFREAVVVSDHTLNDPLYYSGSNPAEGISGITAVSGDTAYFGNNSEFRHFYLVSGTQTQEGQLVYTPVDFHTVTMHYGIPSIQTFRLRSAATDDQTQFVQEGQTLTLPTDYIWMDAQGNRISQLTVSEAAEVYAVAPAAAGDADQNAGPVTNRAAANFYIWLDETSFVYIGNVEITDNSYNDYVSKADIAALYNSDPFVSSIVVDDIETGYYATSGVQIRYTYTQPSSTTPSSSFSGNANRIYGNEGVIDFGNVIYQNTGSPRYVTLMNGTADNEYTPINFYTVTLDYSEADPNRADETQYVQAGLNSTLSLSGEYQWFLVAAGTIPATEENLKNISQKTTLYAHKNNLTVTFVYNDGMTQDQTVTLEGQTITRPDDPERDKLQFGGWYTDAALNNLFDFETTVTDSITLYAKWDAQVTFKDGSGKEIQASKTVVENGSLTLPEGYTWTDGQGKTYEDGAEVTITKHTDFVGEPKTYTVTYNTDAVTESGYGHEPETVSYDGSVTLPDLPEGYIWRDNDGNEYVSGQTVSKIQSSKTFTAAEKTVTVFYDVNFPTTAELEANRLGLRTAGSEAVLLGTANVTIPAGTVTTVSNVSEQNVDLYLLDSGSRYSVAHFLGWETENGTLIEPGSNLLYAVLSAYDANGDGTVTLTGKWKYERHTGVNFFIRYNVSDDPGNTGPANYTAAIFSTYVGGMESTTSSTYDIGTLNTAYQIGATNGVEDYNAVTYYEYDQAIRALYGEKATGVWLPEFPSDADMLEALKNTNNLYAVESGTGNSVLVDKEHFNTDNYTIRWYMFKLCSEDGSNTNGGTNTWHIDGLLVKKQGKITVTKQFLGDEVAMTAAETNFSIRAQNGTMTDGVFMPYTGDNARTESLYLADATKTADHSYEWEIDAVSLGEYWQITENAQKVTADGKEYIFYTEYSVYDSDGNITAIAEYGTEATVVGKTYALDVDPDQGLAVDFKNYYYPNDTLLIKKEDADTGQPLGGAEFELWQENSEGIPVRLTFRYDDATGRYVFDSAGNITTISTANTGYSNVVLSDFSYDHGKVILKEVTAPSGYDPAPWVEINQSGTISRVYYNEGDEIAQSDWSKYAEVHENGKVLVVKDRNSEYVTVNVEKQWESADTAGDSVKVVLQANGTRATNIFPNLANVEVTVNAAGSWRYSWTGLPAFANGELVKWSVKEVAINGEATLADGESFANWINTTVLTGRTDSNGNGVDDIWNYRITNTPRRTQIILTKTDQNDKILSGAQFTLTEMELENGVWSEKAGVAERNQTTNEYGILRFDGLTSGAYYRLTEKKAPDGYHQLQESVMLSVNGEGLVQMVNEDGTLTTLDGFVSYTGAYNVRVVNLSTEPLPETGGEGANVYLQCGIALMLMALLVYKKTHRKEEYYSS